MSTHKCYHCDCANASAMPKDRKPCCYCGEVKGLEEGLVAHARREMLRMNTDPWMTQMIINVVKQFANSGHEGRSASFALPIIWELLQFHNLTPLTDDPEEWEEVGDGTWKSTRRAGAFSANAGGVYFLFDEAQANPDQETVFHETWPLNPEMDRIYVDPGSGTVKQYKGEEEGWVLIHDPFAPIEDGELNGDSGSTTSTEA